MSIPALAEPAPTSPSLRRTITRQAVALAVVTAAITAAIRLGAPVPVAALVAVPLPAAVWWAAVLSRSGRTTLAIAAGAVALALAATALVGVVMSPLAPALTVAVATLVGGLALRGTPAAPLALAPPSTTPRRPVRRPSPPGMRQPRRRVPPTPALPERVTAPTQTHQRPRRRQTTTLAGPQSPAEWRALLDIDPSRLARCSVVATPSRLAVSGRGAAAVAAVLAAEVGLREGGSEPPSLPAVCPVGAGGDTTAVVATLLAADLTPVAVRRPGGGWVLAAGGPTLADVRAALAAIRLATPAISLVPEHDRLIARLLGDQKEKGKEGRAA